MCYVLNFYSTNEERHNNKVTAIETDIIENFKTINSKARTQESYFTKISDSRPTWDTEGRSSEGNNTSSEKKTIIKLSW